MKYLFSFVILFATVSNTEVTIQEFEFLTGTWQVENKNSYETWSKLEDTQVTGYAYKLVASKKNISEHVAIRELAGDIIYEATVPTQNQGKTIQFKLNLQEDSTYSFENKNHDFPKKIQYQKLSESLLKVTVLGDNDEGFSYRMHKLKNAP